MPQFTTISPTHIAGMKEYAWKQFREKGYIAIGFMDVDLTGKSMEEVKNIVLKADYSSSDVDTFAKFLSLKKGDYVAVNNANNGLFGVGIIESGYQYQSGLHDSGKKDESYSHFFKVRWVYTDYVKRKDIIGDGETGWSPYGTMGKVYSEVPLYIRRLLGEKPVSVARPSVVQPPEYLKPIIKAIESLRKDEDHQERAHESLVEDFLVALGYSKHEDIKYRQGRIDIALWANNNRLIIFEVKREWDLNPIKSVAAIKQAYGYALEVGCRMIAVTNGDDYLLFDRIKGLTIEKNMVGQFRLSALTEDDLGLIERLKSGCLRNPDIAETLRFVAEAFTKNGE